MKQLLMVVKFTMSLGAIILTEVSFLPCSDEKTDDDFNPFSDEAYNKMKSLHDERDNLNFKNKMKEIKRNLSTSQKKEVEKIMKNKIK
jgi:hypothetical protein